MKAAGGSPRGRGLRPYGLIMMVGVGAGRYRGTAQMPSGPRGTGHVAGYARTRGRIPTLGAYKGNGGRGSYDNRQALGSGPGVRPIQTPSANMRYWVAVAFAERSGASTISQPTNLGHAPFDGSRVMDIQYLHGGSRESAGGDTRLGHVDTRHELAASRSRPSGWHSNPGRGPQGPRFR